MLAVISVLIVLTLSLLIGRIAAVALTVTGIPREVARFQARSAMTGTGFTTQEAESIVAHPVRRRLVMVLMLVGNIGAAGLIASLIGSFLGISSAGAGLSRALMLLGGLLALLLIARSPWVDRRLARVIGAAVRRFTDLDVRDYAAMLRLSGDYAVSELYVEADDWIADTPLAELDLPHEGVLVLGIVRSDGHYLGAPTGSSAARAGDTLIVYGRIPVLEDIDRRHAGREGEQAHARAVAEQHAIDHPELRVEHQLDPTQVDA
jgi:K+/H+ antiporter YhaU regulatory subunit KhtT